jgi:hypothetical protein
MSLFTRLPIEATPQAMLEEALAEMEAQLEGWDSKLGEYEMILLQAIIWRLVWPFIQLAARVDATIFNEWGKQIVAVAPQEAQKASVLSTWTVRDALGYTIKAGTQVDVARSGDDRVGFLVVADVEVPPGSTSTAAGEVILEAARAGLDGNGVGDGPGILIDAYGYVEGIAIEGLSDNGADAEDPEHFLGRLAETMQTFIEGVVVANDVAIVSRNVPGIGRVTVLDNYNAETEEDEQEKTTTVAVTGDLGGVAAVWAKEALEAVLAEKREVNYLFFVVDADYNLIDVEATVVPSEGYGQAAAVASAQAAIQALLDPLTAFQDPPGDDATWANTTVLRFQDLVTVVNNAQGVDHYTNLKWRKGVEAMAAADIALTGPAPLPKPDVITVT